MHEMMEMLHKRNGKEHRNIENTRGKFTYGISHILEARISAKS
jgi:hypothetical protein